MHVSRDAKSPEHALVAYATGTLKVRQTAGHVFFFVAFLFSLRIFMLLSNTRGRTAEVLPSLVKHTVCTFNTS